MLKFKHVSCGYDGHRVLRNFSLQIRAGELAVLLGPSGVGKTTVLHLAARLISPDAGEIFNSFERMAMVFQEPRLLPWLSVCENVGLVLPDLPKKVRWARSRLWLKRLGLGEEYCEKSPAELSGGERQRVAIARAFVIQPDLVLMDEPFSALDLGARQSLQNITRQLAVQTGTAILFVTHDVPEAVRLADRLLMLSGVPGTLTADFPHTPVAEPDAIWRGAAALVQRCEFAPLTGKNTRCDKEGNCSVLNKCEINATNATHATVAQ